MSSKPSEESSVTYRVDCFVELKVHSYLSLLISPGHHLRLMFGLGQAGEPGLTLAGERHRLIQEDPVGNQTKGKLCEGCERAANKDRLLHK